MQAGPIRLDRCLIGCEGRQVGSPDLGVLDGLNQVVERLVDRRLSHVRPVEEGVEVGLGLGRVGASGDCRDQLVDDLVEALRIEP